jgi:hypothetical protein
MNRFIVRTFQIDGVRAINRQPASIDIAAHRSDHTKIFVLIIAVERGREKNERQSAAVSEDNHFKFAAQPGRVPFDVTFVPLKIGRPSWLRDGQMASPVTDGRWTSGLRGLRCI